MTKLLPLIDGDILVYACGFSADSQMKAKLANDGVANVDVALANEDYLRYALANAKTVISDICERFSTDDCRVFLTGSGNFREYMATLRPYKGNRDSSHKPKYYKEITAYLIDVWKAEVIHGREADDALGCAQMEAEQDTTVIVSIDKDLDNVPGHHYNWRKKEAYYVDEEQADVNFWTQVLTGDTTDNIPGLPKIGPVRAKAIIDGTDKSWTDMAMTVLGKYTSVYGEAEGTKNFYENASLIWMQRKDGINFDDQPYRFPEIPVEQEEDGT